MRLNQPTGGSSEEWEFDAAGAVAENPLCVDNLTVVGGWVWKVGRQQHVQTLTWV